LLAGDYYFKAGIFDPSAQVRWDFSHRFASFRVVGPYIAEGVLLLDHAWTQGKQAGSVDIRGALAD
jgi:hypothetical protein